MNQTATLLVGSWFMKDFYYLLGVDAAATAEEIRDAFRQLSGRFDVDDPSSQTDFLRNYYRELSEAFEVLSNPTRRMRYDAALKRAGKYPGQAAPQRSVFSSVDIAFTIVLILITVLFGDYVIRSITGVKKFAKPAVSAIVEKPEGLGFVAKVKLHKVKKLKWLNQTFYRLNILGNRQ